MRRGVPFLLVFAGMASIAPGRRASADERLTFQAGVPLAAALAKAKAADHPVVVDLGTASCTWCKALERDTFSSAIVAKAVLPAVCVRYDAATTEGGDVVRRFGVRGFPTVLFLDAEGAEIDRIVGYRPPARFAKEASRIKAGEGTLKAVRLAHERDPASAEAAAAYARRLVTIGETGKARALLEGALGAQDPRGGDARPALLLGLAELHLRLEDDESALGYAERATAEEPDAPEAADAWLLRVEIRARRGEVEAALVDAAQARERVKDDEALAALDESTFKLLRHRESTTLERWGERAAAARDVESLDAVARAAFESRLVLGSALRWAERAAELSARDGDVLVTLAELLFEVGREEQALAVAIEAKKKAQDEGALERLDVVLDRLAHVATPTASERPASSPEEPAAREPAPPQVAPAPMPPPSSSVTSPPSRSDAHPPAPPAATVSPPPPPPPCSPSDRRCP